MPRKPLIRNLTAFFQAPVKGWNPDTPPHLLPEGQAPILDNLIPESGLVRMRGGFIYALDFTNAGLSVPCGFIGGLSVPTNSLPYVVMGRGLRGGSARADPWAAIRSGIGGSLIAPAATKFRYLDKNGSSGDFTCTADQMPGPRWVRFGSQLYGISYDASTAPTTSTVPGGVGITLKNTNLLTFSWDGTTANIVTPTAYPTTAPRGAFDIKVYLSRLWLGAGVDVPSSGTTFSPTKIFYTNPGTGGTLGTVAADWKDPTFATSNSFELDQNYTDPFVGFGVFRNVMVLFRQKSTWVMTGNSSTNWATKPIAHVGCIDMRSIVETDAGIFFMSTQGFMYTDGVNVKNVSGPVTNSLRTAATVMENDLEAALPAWCTSAYTQSGDILITMGSEQLYAGANASQNQNPMWCGLFTPSTGTWVRITSQNFAIDNTSTNIANLYPTKLLSTISQNSVFAVGDNFATYIESPNSPLRNSFGQGWAINSAGTLRPNALYDVRPITAGSSTIKWYSIPATWMTPNLNVLSPGSRVVGRAYRLWLDYAWQNYSNLPLTTGWVVKIVDASGLDQGFAMTVPKGSSPIAQDVTVRPVPNVQRAYLRWSNEISDDYITVSWSDATPRTISNAGVGGQYYDIYGVALEYWPVGPEEPMP